MATAAGAPMPSPYKGLMPYDEEDAPYFFGRTRETRLIIANLFAAPVTVLLGSSGVGKSSVLRAGVVSKLRERDDVLPVLHSAWREDPGEEVKRAVSKAVFSIAPRSESQPKGFASEHLADQVRLWCRQANRHLMLIFDQFEEFFLYHSAFHPFLDELANAVNSSALNPRFAPSADPLGIHASGDDETQTVVQTALGVRIGKALYSLHESRRAGAWRVLETVVADAGKPVSLHSLSKASALPSAEVEAIGRTLIKNGLLEPYGRDDDTIRYAVAAEPLSQFMRSASEGEDPIGAAVAAWLSSPVPVPVSYLLSLREDALAKLDLFEGRIPDLMERLLRIEGLDRAGAREAMTRPLDVYNARNVDHATAVSIQPELVEQVLDEVIRGRISISEYALGGSTAPATDGDDAIDTAFLQLVMTRLWGEEARALSPVLRLATLRQLNGAENIVRTSTK